MNGAPKPMNEGTTMAEMFTIISVFILSHGSRRRFVALYYANRTTFSSPGLHLGVSLGLKRAHQWRILPVPRKT